MNNDFRQRVFLPIILPVGVILGFFGFAFMLSRVLLAVEETASTAIALGLAAYVLAIAAIVASRPRITSRALAVGVALGLVAVVAAGMIASAVGMREMEHEGEETAEAGEGGAAGEEAPGAQDMTAVGEAGSGGLEWVAIDIEFEKGPTEAKAGEQKIVLVNNGAQPHNVTIPKLGETPVVEAAGGETAEATVTLEPGTYEYFCSVAGHEQLMKGTLTVE